MAAPAITTNSNVFVMAFSSARGGFVRDARLRLVPGINGAKRELFADS
jgi:hypothetical protein